MLAIYFINTPVPELNDDKLEPNMGLLYLMSYIQNNSDYRVRYIELSMGEFGLGDKLIEDGAILCFSCYTATYGRTIDYLRLIRRTVKRIVSVAGGPHASALPGEVLNDFDYVITGEGETALLRLITYIDRGRYPSDRIITGEPIMDLDSIPHIDYSSVDIAAYTRVVDGKKSLSVLTTRGCPYQCVFCNSITMGPKVPVRLRSAHNIYSELRSLNRKYGTEGFRIQDDLFGVNLKILAELCREVQGAGFVFRCFTRADFITEERMAYFQAMGVKHVSIGVESGSDFILQRMQKRSSRSDVIRAFKLLNRYKIKTRIFLIVGFPGETYETISETASLVELIKPDEISIYPLIPYPGTDVYNNPAKFNITYIDSDFSKYFQVYGDKQTGYVFETDELTRNDIRRMREHLVARTSRVAQWAGESRRFR